MSTARLHLCLIVLIAACMTCSREEPARVAAPVAKAKPTPKTTLPPPQPIVLDVVITPKSRRYSVKENQTQIPVAGEPNTFRFGTGFPLAFSVRNQSSRTANVGYWTCSTYNNWKTDTPDVVLSVRPCYDNAVLNHEIPPGGAFTGDIGVFVSERLIGKHVTFRLAFVSVEPFTTGPKSQPTLGTFWSNPITLHVVK